jgi:hypothetical protein
MILHVLFLFVYSPYAFLVVEKVVAKIRLLAFGSHYLGPLLHLLNQQQRPPS